MIQEYDNDSLDPLEQMIRDLWKAQGPLRDVFGPYFDWNTEKQGLPFCVCIGSGGDGPNLYDMNILGVINQVSKRFDIWHSDRGQLLTQILPLVSATYERRTNVTLKGNQVCLSVVMETAWHTVFEQAKDNALNLNSWHSFAAFRFRVEKRAGVV